jgi:hypothetical protein
MRRRTAVPALALALVATGCGGSSGSAGSSGASGGQVSPSASPSASPSPVEQPVTKAQATAAAHAINLTTAEVGAGYTSTPAKNDPSSDKDSAAFAACVGATPPAASVADVSSPDFTRGSGLQTRQVSSDVTVVATTARARADLTAFTGPKTMPCLKTFITKTLAGSTGSGVTFGIPVVTRLDTPTAGTDGAFGYDVKMTAKATGVTIAFDVQLQAVLVKRCEVSLTVFSLGGDFPAAERTQLLQTLLAKAQKNAV